MAPTKTYTLLALLGLTASQKNDNNPITCVNNGFTYFMGGAGTL